MRVRAKQARAAESYESILFAAAAEFSEKGYAGTSIATVAERAGTQKGNVQYHFRTKSDIVSALIARVFDGGRYLGAGIDPDSRGLRAIATQTSFVAKRSVESPFARAAIRLLDERAQVPIALPTPYVGWIEQITKHLEEAVADGELTLAPSTATETAWLIVAGFHGVKNVAIQLGEMDSIPYRSRELLTRHLRSLGVTEPGSYFPIG